ncbi:MAG: hypothetical protein QM791_11300 [Ferruginibacter sp.]
MNSFIEIAREKSTRELLEMIYELDKWDVQMLKACENELSTRNQLPEDFQIKKNEIIEKTEAQLALGKEASMTGVVAGWLCIFGVIGLYIGYQYSHAKVISQYTGKQFFKYNDESRKTGSYIFYASIFGCIIGIIYLITKIKGV